MVAHLFVAFHHGLQGQTKNFCHLKESLDSAAFSPRFKSHLRVTLWDTDVNSWFKTFDGILACAQRYLKELLQALQSWIDRVRQDEEEQAIAAAADAAGSNCEKSQPRLLFSCVGHSLGGLILRCVLPMLTSEKFFAKHRIQLVSYVSIASPHCGVKELSWVSRKFSLALAKCGSVAHRDLLMQTAMLRQHLIGDECLRALALCRFRTLYSSVNNDPFVAFRTGSLCYSMRSYPPHTDPLEGLVRECFVAETRRTGHGGGPDTDDDAGKESERSRLSLNSKSNKCDTDCQLSSVFRPPSKQTTRLLHEVTKVASTNEPISKHLLPTFAIGGNSQAETNCTEEATATDDEHRIARAMLSTTEFVIVPVLSDAVMLSAHKSIIGASRFGRPLSDVIHYTAIRLLVEAKECVV